jgi:maltose/maltodextrin transport system permease protein
VAVFVSRKLYAHRYIFPAVAGMGVFVIFPLMYTVGIGFTNYSASNLLSFDQVKENLLGRTYQSEAVRYDYQLFQTERGYVLYLDGAHQNLVSPPIELGAEDPRFPVLPTADRGWPGTEHGEPALLRGDTQPVYAARQRNPDQ